MPENGRQIFGALLRKEWQEQRWRFFLGATVLSGLLAGLLRAQIIPNDEAVLLIYGPVGLGMVVFLAMGSVASERADRTWEFLTVQPVSRAQILRAKWVIGLAQLIGMMVIATLAGAAAMASRGFRQVPEPERNYMEKLPDFLSGTHPLLTIIAFALIATVSLACWYTPLFFLLTRARQEFTAALGGIVLTIALLIWLMQFSAGTLKDYTGAFSLYQAALFCWGLFNPLSPLVAGSSEEFAPFLPVLLALQVGLWIILPIWLVGAKSGRPIQRWMQT